MREKIKKKGGQDLVAVKENLIDLVWGNDKPARPNEAVKVLPNEYAGKSYQDKIRELLKEIEKKKCAGLVVCRLFARPDPFVLRQVSDA